MPDQRLSSCRPVFLGNSHTTYDFLSERRRRYWLEPYSGGVRSV